MGNWTSTYMCTREYCPCDSSVDFNLWEEDELNEWGRSKLVDSSLYKILYKPGVITNPLTTNTANSNNATYIKFMDCYKYLISYNSTGGNSSTATKVKEVGDGFVKKLLIVNH